MREAFFPTSDHLYSVEAAAPDDRAAIFEIVRAHEGPESRAILDAWWRQAPGFFRVARDRLGGVAGFYVVGEIDRISHRLVEDDPVARRCWDHLRGDPVPRGQRVLFVRILIAHDYGEAPSPVQAAIWLDLKRYYMELRPDLRRLYSTVRDLATWGPKVAPLGFGLVPGDPIEFDGSPYHPAMLDFGPSSVDGWLTKVIASELQIEDDSILDLAQRQLVLDGRRVDLTRLEFEVLHYLYERSGQVVSRASLLRDVWGYEYTGGSNVIEAIVKALRTKLGDQAASIQTIRGIGYRFAPPS